MLDTAMLYKRRDVDGRIVKVKVFFEVIKDGLEDEKKQKLEEK